MHSPIVHFVKVSKHFGTRICSMNRTILSRVARIQAKVPEHDMALAASALKRHFHSPCWPRAAEAPPLCLAPGQSCIPVSAVYNFCPLILLTLGVYELARTFDQVGADSVPDSVPDRPIFAR